MAYREPTRDNRSTNAQFVTESVHDKLPATELAAQVDAQTQERTGAPATHPDFDRLVRTVWRLRQPDGCPWDKEQTHLSITANMIEEAYEAVDAIEAHDTAHLLEEMGDVLEQVLLHAQIAADDNEFTIDDICRALNEKLIRRHTHIFGDKEATSAADALDRWDEVKRQERAAANGNAQVEEQGLLDSIPAGMPALMQAQKISKRAAKAGFDWETVADVWAKVEEERAEFEAEPSGSAQAEEEFGDLLFALVNVARKEGIDAEQALRRANTKFRSRWHQLEAQARKAGQDVSELTVEELNQLWDEVKTAAGAV